MELIDLTLEINSEMTQQALGNEMKSLPGHIGTHFDVMNKSFPLEYTKRNGIAFDVQTVCEREIECSDIDLSLIPDDAFVAFYTGFIEREGYGSDNYRHAHPVLSYALIDALLNRNVSIIGIDFAGIRRGKEHTPADQLCANRGTFIVENICSLGDVLKDEKNCTFIARTFPMKFSGVTGLPCRVLAELAD